MPWTKVKGTALLAASGDPSQEEQAISYAADLLRRGELVAFPTETVYGLGADALNPAAVQKIFKAKERPPDNPLIVHVTGLEDLERLTENIPVEVALLAGRFWPGPLTVVLPKKDIVPAVTTAGLSSVALRIPAHPLTQKLLAAAGVPVAAPSANISGRPSPTTAAHVIEDMAGRIAAVLDGGACPVGVESTVLSLLSKPPVLLRPGGVTLEMLQELLGVQIIDISINGAEEFKDAPPSPGLKYRHYATRAPIYLIEGEGEAQKKQLLALGEGFAMQGRRVGMLICEETGILFPAAAVELLGSKKEPGLVAGRLYGALRRLDAAGVDVIVAEGFSEQDMGRAVMNRLRKAATKIIKPW